MSRLTSRDVAVCAVFLLGGGAVVALALGGMTDWALALLGVILGLLGVVTRLQFASRRALRSRRRPRSDSRRSLGVAIEAPDPSSSIDVREKAESEASNKEPKDALGAQSRPSSARDEPEAQTLAVLRSFQQGEAKRPIGLVGFFGLGNYGDELFIDVFQQFLGARFDLRIIPDLETKPYFSRPVDEKVGEVDAIVLGGGDLIQRWNTDPRYFDTRYLRKPLFVAGVGVPIYQDSEKHAEKPHIISRLQRFFGNPNVRMIGMRDDFSADWVRQKLHPTCPVYSEPDIVCSLELPAASKPEGKPILGIVTRQRRVTTPDDYTRLVELAEHAIAQGFHIRHIILGTGSVGERDMANASAFDVPEKEIVRSEDLSELSRAIGECSVLASMKFHGTVVATMYGVPSIVLVPTNKNRNFMARIGRNDLVAAHDSDRLIEIFGKNGPAPIDQASIQMLRSRSTAFMERLRDEIISEVETQLASRTSHARLP